MLRRLKKVRKTLGLSQKEFAEYLGITQSAYSMIENGSRPFSDKYVRLVCTAFNVNREWLEYGEGEMILRRFDERELTNIYECLAPQTRKSLLVIARELLKFGSGSER